MDSVNGITMTGTGEVQHLNEELPVLLYVLVSRLLLLFLLRLHWDVDVHPQFFAAEKKRNKNNVKLQSYSSVSLCQQTRHQQNCSYFLYPRKSLMTVSGLKSTSSTLAFSSSITLQTDRQKSGVSDMENAT